MTAVWYHCTPHETSALQAQQTSTSREKVSSGQADQREYDEHLLQGLEVNNNILITCQACPHKLSSFMVIHTCVVRGVLLCIISRYWT